VRRDVLRASKAMQERVLNTPNIEVLWNTNTKEILGNEMGVNGVSLLNNKTNELFTRGIDGFFLAIGHHPNSELFNKWVETNGEGYIITKGKSTATNVPGFFAAGDVQDPVYRQAIVAAASGCRAAIDVEKFLLQEK
jgi:thioredoxin reductase (NADPH)